MREDPGGLRPPPADVPPGGAREGGHLRNRGAASERGGGRAPGSGPPGGGGPSVGSYAGAGLQFAVAIVLSVYLGQWLDRRFGTEPWLLLLTLLAGAGGTFYSIYLKLMAELRRDEEARKR